MPASVRRDDMAERTDLSGLRLQALDSHCRPRHGKTKGKARTLPMLQRGLPVSVYRDDTYAPAFHQVAVEHMAQGSVVDSAIGQRPLLGAAGRGARCEPANGLAHGSRPAIDGGARNTTWRHRRNRRVLSWWPAEERSEERRVGREG